MTSFARSDALRASERKNSPVRRAGEPLVPPVWWKRAVFYFFGLALSAALSPLPLPAAEARLFGEPVLKIVYAAESRGQVYPCFY